MKIGSELKRAISVEGIARRATRDLEYPRATVIHNASKCFILVFTDAARFTFLRKYNPAPVVLRFDTRTAAITHAQREVHALRARRHPAGQSWLRDERP